MAMVAPSFIFALVLSSFLGAFACTHPGSVKFGYRGADGPDRWGSLSPQFALCSKGLHQSPINIVKGAAVHNPRLKPLIRDYRASNATLVDNVFNIMLRYDEAVGAITVDGKQYTLKQMHWHSPSEHTIDGRRFDMELHMVHVSDDGNITVVGVLYKYGNPDPFFFQIKNGVAELAEAACKRGQEAQVPVGDLKMKAMKHGSRREYFRYVGSLTTPPCTENVIWIIPRKVREMSKEQGAALRAPLTKAYRHNSRPLQPLNRRAVELCTCKERRRSHRHIGTKEENTHQ